MKILLLPIIIICKVIQCNVLSIFIFPDTWTSYSIIFRKCMLADWKTFIIMSDRLLLYTIWLINDACLRLLNKWWRANIIVFHYLYQSRIILKKSLTDLINDEILSAHPHLWCLVSPFTFFLHLLLLFILYHHAATTSLC